MSDYELAKSILDRYSFTRKRTIECVAKWGLPTLFNPYTKSKLLIAPTLTTSCDRTCATGTVLIKESKNMSEYAIRKLTPTECYILMGMVKKMRIKPMLLVCLILLCIKVQEMEL